MDNPRYKNYPVIVKGMSIDWIINIYDDDNHGKEFLEALVNAQDLDIFDCETIIAIVEFLY